MNNDASLPAAVDSNRELIIRAQRGLLERMQKDLQGDALSSEQLLKYAQALNDMLKQVGAHDKVLAVLEIARLKAAAPRPQARASARPSRSSAGGQFADDGPDAPYGRRDDGAPYTHQEFKAALARSVRDIYGISMPDCSSHEPPKSAAPQSASHAARQGPKSTRVAPLSSPLTPAARAATLYWPGGMSAARSGHPSALSMLAPSRKHATCPTPPPARAASLFLPLRGVRDGQHAFARTRSPPRPRRACSRRAPSTPPPLRQYWTGYASPAFFSFAVAK